VAALEVPVRVSGETVVCDVVLFNSQAGHLLAVEAKSGANLEPEQGRRLTALTPQLLVIAGGITVPKLVPPHCEVLYACLADDTDRICLGADEAGLRVPVLAVSGSEARLLRPQMAGPLLSAALGSPAVWTHPIARIVPFDHESPAEAFDRLIAMYNEPGRPPGPDRTPALMSAILRKSLTIRGFTRTEFAADLMGEFLQRATPWVHDGSLKHKEEEDIVDGPENALEASLGMLDGKNFGKLLVRVS
jgi:hypothetical protein